MALAFLRLYWSPKKEFSKKIHVKENNQILKLKAIMMDFLSWNKSLHLKLSYLINILYNLDELTPMAFYN